MRWKQARIVAGFFVMVSVLATAAACDDDDGNDGGGTPSRSPSPTVPDRWVAKLVGPHEEVVDFERSDATPRVASQGQALAARDILATDANGHATALVYDRAICGLESESRTELLPDGVKGETLHEASAGMITCISFRGVAIIVRTILGTFHGSGTAIRTVVGEEGTLTVRVYEGGGTLESAESGEVVEMAAGEEASVPPDGSVSKAEAFGLSPQELETLRALQDALKDEPFADALRGNPALSLEASFSASPAEATVGAPVQFAAAEFEGAQYTWDFGDGTGGTGASPTHTYSRPGTFTVTLTVEADEGMDGSDEARIGITGAVTPEPTVTLTSEPTVGPTPEPSASPTSEPTVGPTPPPTPTPTPTCNADLEIEMVDKEKELVTIRNDESEAVVMTGWRLVSVTGSQVYFFPSGYELGAGAEVIITSGPGAIHQPPATLRWSTAYIWRNDEPDPAELYDACDNLISAWPPLITFVPGGMGELHVAGALQPVSLLSK